ncbi:MAG: hypothetical protein U0230_22720 [Polyangiales bacterium]
MAEPHGIRENLLTGGHAIVAPGRAAVSLGPDALSGLPKLAGACPFCPGHEPDTDVALALTPTEGPWAVRVVRNKYPALHAEPPELPPPSGGRSIPGFGHHEVVVESPEHDGDVATYPEEHARRLFEVLRDRVAAAESLAGIGHVSLFRNRGQRAGASQPHPHSQIVASPVPGLEQAIRWERALGHYAALGTNLLDDVLASELEAGARIVEEDANVVVLVPFAPQRTFECWVVPRRARGSISAVDDATLRSLSRLLPRAIRRALGATGRTDYNLLFRLPPVAHRHHPAAFWYVEVLPRGTLFAGFELVSGMPLIYASPEATAARYRDFVLP